MGLIAATPVLYGASESATQPFSRGLLYRLDKAGVASSYVFGTLHSSDARVTQYPKPVADALDASKTLALEIQFGERDAAEIFASAQFADGRRLTDFFDSPSLASIRAALGTAAPADDVFVRLKPWAVLLKLSEDPVGTDRETLDERLLAEAKRRRLSVIGLEMAEEQISAFDTIPLATQVALVQFILVHRAALARDHDAVIAAWLDRDLGKLAALNAAPGLAHPEIAAHFAELTRHLIDNRSVQMAHRLFLPLRAGRIFVAVGALHLYGTGGLLALLEAQGYRVSAVY